MQPFCNNAECSRSEIKVKEGVHDVDTVDGKGNHVRVERYLYMTKNGEMIFLCTTCHNAVQLVKNG